MRINGTSGDDQLDGSGDPDEMFGGAGDDLLDGHGGHDHLWGDLGDDTLRGGEGDDQLSGGSGNDTLDGGVGDDRLSGGKTGHDEIIFRDGYGHDVIMDFRPGEDVVRLTASGVETWDDLKPRIGAAPDGTAILKLDDGSVLRFEGLRPEDLGPDDFIIDPPPVCFAAGTPIATPCGERPVEALRPGDLVLTWEGEVLPVLWVGSRLQRFGHGPHRHRPILVPAGALGPSLPRRDIALSPQHRVLIRGKGRGRFAGGALARAKGLCGTGGVRQDEVVTSVRYLQLLLPRHAVLRAAGLGCESFYPGPFALETLPRADRERVQALVPGVWEDVEAAYGPPARPILTMRQILELPREGRLSVLPLQLEAAA